MITIIIDTDNMSKGSVKVKGATLDVIYDLTEGLYTLLKNLELGDLPMEGRIKKLYDSLLLFHLLNDESMRTLIDDIAKKLEE